MEPIKPPHVYRAIVAVMADLSKAGIGKDRKNTQQGYSFRGVDDVYNALAPILAKQSLAILPRVLSRTSEERQTKSGGTLFYVVVDVEFSLVSAEDGSVHVVRFIGEAMDSADKATNKAMSAAYKYAAFQTFCIPTEGDNDADAHHPEPVASPTAADLSDAARNAQTRGWTKADFAALLDSFGVTKLGDVRPNHRAGVIAKLGANPPNAHQEAK